MPWQLIVILAPGYLGVGVAFLQAVEFLQTALNESWRVRWCILIAVFWPLAVVGGLLFALFYLLPIAVGTLVQEARDRW